MKRFPILLALAASLALPTFAQQAPVGWKTQARANGAKTFTPPDLAAGETYSVTIYDSAPLGGKTLGEYLNAFAGLVGQKPGQLSAPLKIKAMNAQAVTGTSAYNAPNGQALNVALMGVSSDGQNISVLRTLYSSDDVFLRHKEVYSDLSVAMARGAAQNAPQTQGPRPEVTRSRVDDEPQEVANTIKVGGPIVPGMYEAIRQSSWSAPYGPRQHEEKIFRVYLYADGEYRITDQHDEDLSFYGVGAITGRIKYNPKRGLLDFLGQAYLRNENSRPADYYCYYGLDTKGKPTILARHNGYPSDVRTMLEWKGPPTGRKSTSEEAAPARALEAKKKAAQDKLNGIQTRVAPGRGVPASQIAALVHNFQRYSYGSQQQQTVISPGHNNIYPKADGSVGLTYIPGIIGQVGGAALEDEFTDEAYLLLRDGTAYRELQIAPDQFDVRASRQKEPEKWGLWKQVGGKIQVSFGGKPYEALEGERVLPREPNTRWSGSYGANNPEIKSAITFTSSGRFKRTPLDPKKDPSAPFTLSKATKVVAGGELSGTYSVDGYSMTLRYDNGKVERTPFFFVGKNRESLWFEGYTMMIIAEAKPK